ncbi:hypothetical protein OBBRIDRAFT_792139 [Obba rivulosa]|uniref:F-box domain-containing protein n=1 Tax=Obba rivulosa TaxID=1052685 RepID=A0A8E2AV25_9APHY|nr:hypothetical protein OBBRIDRAFT_792139 [Obba rivulosa]
MRPYSRDDCELIKFWKHGFRCDIAPIPYPSLQRKKPVRFTKLHIVPADVMLEICSYLQLRDVFHLSRINKTFRRLLTSHHAAFVWRSAVANEKDLPMCPKHLNELQYANLLYSPHCHNCLRPNVNDINWVFRVRYCDNCYKRETKHYRTVDTIPGIEREFGTWEGDNWSLLPAIEELRPWLRWTRHVNGVRVRNSDYEALLQSWWVIKGCPEEEAELFGRERFEYTGGIHNHARLMKEWEKREAERREADSRKRDEQSKADMKVHDFIREVRLKQIIINLRRLGYDRQLASIEPSSYASLAASPVVQTLRTLRREEWEKIQKPVINVLVEAHRKEVLRPRYCALDTFLASCFAEERKTPASELRPKAIDLAMMPEFRALIDAPDDVQITTQSFEPLREQMDTFVERWHADIKHRLVEWMLMGRPENRPFPADVDPVALASAVFPCGRCPDEDIDHRVHRYPGIIAHPCFRIRTAPADTAYERNIGDIAGINPLQLKPNGLHVDHQKIHEILESCGKDPDRVTIQEMDDLDVHVFQWCRGQLVKKNSRIVHWRLAIEMWFRNVDPYDPSPPIYHCMLASKADKSRRLKTQLPKYHDSKAASLSHWCCALCDNASGRNKDLFDVHFHVRNMHAVESPVKRYDFYWNPGAIYPLPTIY